MIISTGFILFSFSVFSIIFLYIWLHFEEKSFVFFLSTFGHSQAWGFNSIYPKKEDFYSIYQIYSRFWKIYWI